MDIWPWVELVSIGVAVAVVVVVLFVFVAVAEQVDEAAPVEVVVLAAAEPVEAVDRADLA